MFPSHQWQKATAMLLALGITIGTGAPMVLPAPAAAQRLSQFYDQRIAAGTLIPVNYEKDKIIVTTDETAPLTLTVAQDIRSAQGTVVIPAGSQLVGQLQPARRGSQFVAKELIIGGRRRSSINAISNVVTRTEQVQKGANTGSILQGAAVGAAAATVLAGVTGDKAIATEEVLGGAGLGAIAGVLLGRRKVDVVVIYPNRDLSVKLRSDLVLR
ncbi:MAG: hypothetical protein ACM37W_20750 [Actinomycetota bacterium]